MHRQDTHSNRASGSQSSGQESDSTADALQLAKAATSVSPGTVPPKQELDMKELDAKFAVILKKGG